MKLYILGNGFDVAHGLSTKYLDFENYVKSIDKELYDKLNEIYPSSVLWFDFEKGLGEADISLLKKIDDLFGIKGIVGNSFADKISTIFGQWISEIDYSKAGKLFSFSDNDIFFSFNYTDTLNSVYGIQETNIIHIHNFVGDCLFELHKLIVGHNNSNFGDCELLKSTYKDTKKIIAENKQWFDDLNSKPITDIEVIGHSYNLIDVDYFDGINKHLPDVKWLLNYHTDEDKTRLEAFVNKVGIRDYEIKEI